MVLEWQLSIEDGRSLLLRGPESYNIQLSLETLSFSRLFDEAHGMGSLSWSSGDTAAPSGATALTAVGMGFKVPLGAHLCGQLVAP